MSRQPIPRPFLKWAGGKSKLTDVLAMHLPEHFGCYYEPFLGSGAFFFYLYRRGLLKNAVISDINQELIDTYLAIRDRPMDVIKILSTFPNHKDFYYHIRECDPQALDLAMRAARMIYLNKTCYNGLYRVNRQGRFNVPFGGYQSPCYADPDNLLAVSRALQGVEIYCAPFEAAIDKAAQGDLIYLDPPYMPISKTSNFTAYSPEGFRPEDQERLRDACLRLTERGVYIMLSNSYSPYIESLYHQRDFYLNTIFASRNINSDLTGRGRVKEFLILNYRKQIENILFKAQDDICYAS